MTTTKLLQRAETVRTRLRTRLEALPDRDDAPTERLRLAVTSEALNLRSVEGRLQNLVQRVKKPKSAHDLKPWVAWRNVLVKGEEHFEDRLFHMGALPRVEQNRRSTELFAVRRALHVITHGANSEEGGSPLVETWLREQGVLPMWGERVLFAGRGGLRMTKKRIIHIQGRLAESETALDNTLTTAEAFLAKPEVTAVRSPATV